jgi:Arc/MetJ-type ribon-helix-helix transcriptional regulator
MAIQIPVDVEAVIREKVASGHYADDAAVMREAMAALDERDRRRRLLDLLAEADDDEVVPYSASFMAETSRLADEDERLGLPIDPDVCP